ncbi:hypothetical protein N510_000142 [Firmicutes bacterium ASF500]|nr:hypothetical protein N510_000142 [Firmicutes bacterium ASF500]
MPDLKPFFSVNAWGDSLTTGATLKIVHSLHYSDYNASPFMALLTDKPAAELQKMLKGSEGAEKSIYEKLKTAVSKWEAQAAQTLLLEKVLEYVRTPEVSHTSNEWKQIEGGAWEISNRVYQMRYQFTPVPQSEAVRVTWGIVYNTPQQPGNPRYANSWGDSRYIVRQEKKPYDSVEAAQRYIQGRFNLYAHLFTELSPPVPNDCKRMFMVNGHLLPGYTLAPPERTKEEAVNDLLDCLEDGDVVPPISAPEPPPAPKEKTTAPSPAKPVRSAAKKKTGPKKSAPKKSGPVR